MRNAGGHVNNNGLFVPSWWPCANNCVCAFDGKSEVMICDDVQCTYKLYLRVRRIFIITYYFYYFALL